jgi:hypothetical protein
LGVSMLSPRALTATLGDLCCQYGETRRHLTPREVPPRPFLEELWQRRIVADYRPAEKRQTPRRGRAAGLGSGAHHPSPHQRCDRPVERQTGQRDEREEPGQQVTDARGYTCVTATCRAIRASSRASLPGRASRAVASGSSRSRARRECDDATASSAVLAMPSPLGSPACLRAHVTSATLSPISGARTWRSGTGRGCGPYRHLLPHSRRFNAAEPI